MKKLFLILVLSLNVLLGFSQYDIEQRHKEKINQKIDILEPIYIPDQRDLILINSTEDADSSGWTLRGSGYAGDPAYWYQILRTDTAIMAEDSIKYYYYYLNLYSASTYSDGSKASTYIKDINCFIGDSLANSKHYVLLHPDEITWVNWVRTKCKKDRISFEIVKISVH